MLRQFARRLPKQSLSLLHSRFASTLVLVDHNNKDVLPSTLATVTAASKIGGDITALVAGNGCADAAAATAKIAGVSKVLLAEKPQYDHGLAENVSALILELQNSGSYTHIIGGATPLGKGCLPRVAAQLDVCQISDILEVQSEDTFVRPMYAGNVFAQVQSSDATKVITVRATAFEKADASSGSGAVEVVDIDANANVSKWESEEIVASDRPDLASAKIVVAGGRGMKSADQFNILYGLADKMGAAVGATRAAVDSEFCPNDLQIGQTGKVIAPELYIGFGISGAIQHIAGMKDSKIICAINKDPDAPIFTISDHGVVEDLFKAIPEMESKF
mmetsp:Transcript_39395/g.85324  ORF Transcript_39395/g.85324 Transcript_39395/m.85324 type:complete len:333 (-) Transcript_39395:53-1051(-)